jgi:hypothetical protein
MPKSKPKKKPPSRRNLAAKALGSPLFRPKIVPAPAAEKRKPRFASKLILPEDGEQ